MSLTHEDKVKKKMFNLVNSSEHEIEDRFRVVGEICARRKEDNLKIIDVLRGQVESFPDMRFEQLLVCFLGELEFYREPSATLATINKSIEEYGKNR